MIIAWLLIVEGLSTAVWIGRLLPMLPALGAVVTLTVVLRGIVGAMQLSGGVFVLGRRPIALPLARWSLIGSAVLTTVEIGLRVAPSNMTPSLRWPLVLAYWIYALGAVWFLGPPPDRRRWVRTPLRLDAPAETPGAPADDSAVPDPAAASLEPPPPPPAEQEPPVSTVQFTEPARKDGPTLFD